MHRMLLRINRTLEYVIVHISRVWLDNYELKTPNNWFLCFVYCAVFLAFWWPRPSSVDGVWNEWSSWGSCSASCSNGTMQRTRECNGPSYGGSECRGEFLETVDCFLGECPGTKQKGIFLLCQNRFTRRAKRTNNVTALMHFPLFLLYDVAPQFNTK